MDSGNNSGSMQSSSGGGGGGSDQEYDSRPPFFNPLTHLGSTSSNPPSFLLNHHHQQQQQQPNFFDPSSFHALSQSLSNPNPLLDLDAIHSQAPRSDGSNAENPLSSMQLRSLHDGNVRSSAQSDQSNHNNGGPVPRNPKKRTRASRRAPTTVLTTDTSNFRAMVQEFTGIPAPPFTGPSYSRRLDLFGSVGSALRSGHLDGPLYQPLRPSAQKVQQSQLLPSPSSLMLSTENITVKPNSSNYQNMANMQNQNNILSFQSLLHHQNPPPINESAFGAKLSQGQGSMTLASLNGLASTSFGGGPTNQDHQVRGATNFDGNYSSLNGCKLNFSASTSEFLNDKGLVDNVVTTRGAQEGTVDSWICSSD